VTEFATIRSTCARAAIVVLALLGLAVMQTPDASAAAPSYYPSGPQVNVDESQLTGWVQCWTGLYGHTVSLATVLAACNGDYLLLAGGPVASTVFNVVAAAPRADVLHDTGTSNTPHNANGTGWYYSATRSWGFADEGDPIQRNSCDVNNVNPTQRLCWHTNGNNMNGGFRSGANVFLNSSTTFRRVIYQASPPLVATPTGDGHRAGYCSVDGNTWGDGTAIPAGTFLNLGDGQSTAGLYMGATPANYLEGLGISCDVPAGYARTGETVGFHGHGDPGLYRFYSKTA
jgi:hypothetical protein